MKSNSAEKLVFENISKLGKTIEKHSKEELQEDEEIRLSLYSKLIALESILHPLKDEKYSGIEGKDIPEYSYQEIVDQYRELSKLAGRVYDER